jgi:glycine/D-amino acid oxidase-like deaminating enzyme
VIASFAEAARDHGVDVRLGVEVKWLIVAGDRVAGVDTNEGRYECRTLVLAAGPWAAPLAKTAKLALPVQTVRTQAALFRRPPDCGRRGAIYGDFVQGLWFKPAPGDLIHAGPLGDDRPPVDPDRCDEAADAAWLPQVRQRLSRRYPAMHRGYGRGGYGALQALTPDGHPILDRWPGLEGAYLAVGFSGEAFPMAPVVGPLLAEMIIDGRTQTLDVTPLRLSRFAEDEPIKTEHPYSLVE